MKILIYLLIILLSISAYSQEIYFEHLRVENGLSQSSALSIYQDELGTIWIATRDGLNRYNGKEIEIFKPVFNDSTSIPANNVRLVCGDKKGHLFVHSKYAASAYDLKTQKFSYIKKSGVQTIHYGLNNLWVCTPDSIFSYRTESNVLTPFYSFDKFIGVNITSIFESSEGELFVGTQGKGLFIVNKNKKISHILPDIHVVSFYEDIYGNIWITTRWTGLFVMKDNNVIAHYTHKSDDPKSISSDFARAVCMDNLGNYWIATLEGLDKLDFKTNTFEHYRYSRNELLSLGNSSIWSVIKDKHGTIWLGSYFGGVDYFNPESGFFSIYNADETDTKKLGFPVISRMVEDKYGNLWIGTEGGGLNYLNRKDNRFMQFKYNPSKNSISNNVVKTLLYDGESEILWIGTHLGGLNSYDIKNNTFRTYLFEPGSKGQNHEDGIRHILNYKDKIIIGSMRGVKLFDKNTHKFTRLINDDTDMMNHRQIINMMIDKDENLWFSIATDLYRYDLNKKQLYKMLKNFELDNSISVIYQDSSDRIWLGTTGRGIGLFNFNNDSIYFYDSNNSGIVNDYINDIKESKSGDILISTNLGLSRLDVDQKRFYNYNSNNGFPVTATNENSLYITNDKEIFLGGMTGLISFPETNLNIRSKPTEINFVGLKVNNEKILPGDRSGILKESIYYTDEIELNHRHSIITVDFATTGYTKSMNTDIQYMLEGFDKRWTSSGFSNSVTYTNLNPGVYKLKMRVNPNDVEEKNITIKTLNITVNPPFYKTTLAYIIFVLLGVGLILLIFNFYISKLKFKTSLEFEKKEKLQMEELNQSKLRFFTNISHEFRTPLTIINSQIEMILQMNDIKPTVYNKLLSIFRNTERMKKLINELIDFRKQEQGFLQIKAFRQNLIPFLYEIYVSFKDMAASRHIALTFFHEINDLDVWFDTSQLEKVFYNLLSNAFKYTPDKGEINISVNSDSDSVTINITDNGLGIDETDLNKIFERFYQSGNITNNSVKNVGSGIGLAVCKNIVDAHKGNISVTSKENQGSTFSVKLQLGENHFRPDEKDYMPINKKLDTTKRSNLLIDKDFIEEVKSSQEKVSDQLPLMLIVEDEEEVRKLLNELLSPFFRIIQAEDGKAGSEKVKEIQPDIVLSDVMLPYMSGIDMCYKIKTDLETCHIPVVLLTAQTAIEYTIKGLKTGADDYVTKPFNIKVLISRCNNLVNNRKILQQKYANDLDLSPRMIATNAMEQEFIEKAHRVIEENLDNTQFDVNVFAQEMAVGRSMLFAKIKGMTGQTPNELITNVRLKKSIILLKSRPDLSITEISYEVGFSSSSYFIKCFREFYNQTPAGFRKQLR